MNYVVIIVISIYYSTAVICLAKTGSEVNPFHIAW
jgi:hypothetical protein